MENERYVAAIEISSSKIIAAVGRTDGVQLDIIASEQIEGPETVRFGIIQNAEEAATRILSIMDRLETRPVPPSTSLCAALSWSRTWCAPSAAKRVWRLPAW